MFDKWLKIPAHYWLRITALVLLVIGVAISNVLMSIGAIWIISNWLIEADFTYYKKRLQTNLPLILILIFLLYSIISIAWSEDFGYAFQDIRIKLPLIAIPIALGTGKPLDKKVFHFLLILFIGIILITSIFNFAQYYYLNNYQDIRKMSWFISHIRYALLINLAIFIAIYLLIKKIVHWSLGFPIILWFIYYLFISQVVNGYILFIILLIVTILYAVSKSENKYIKIITYAIILCFIYIGSMQLNKLIQNRNKLDTFEFKELDFYTANGNPYYHDTLTKTTENGHYVWLYVSNDELKKEWNSRSKINYDSTDKKGQPIYGTAMRYLTSKNLRKDSIGVWSLSDKEILAIENGQTNVNMDKGAIYKFNQLIEEIDLYNHGLDPNGSSTLQRIEHVKTALHILKSAWFLGVGIGDVQASFNHAYEVRNSKLTPENRLRSHNQFLTSWIGLGIIGFLLLLSWFIIPSLGKNNRNYFSCIVLTTLTIGFIFEDMLETQAGATIFALFYSLAVLSQYNEKAIKDAVQ